MPLLERLSGLVAIDEVRRAPELFKVLRVLMDRDAAPAKFLPLGGASRGLLRQSGEWLAGRVEGIEIGGEILNSFTVAAYAHAKLCGLP
ncbi:MAG: AAA family ATPase [Burkholderiales bacterium]